MASFGEALGSGRILLMDGAMGTELMRAGISERECFELWNLTRPARVGAIHRAYVDAGAECLLTNTFQSHPSGLARHGLEHRLEEINAAAVDLAGEAGGGRWVLGDIGPLRPLSETSLGRTLRSLRGVDAFLLETWSADGLKAAEIALKPEWNPDRLPVLLSFTFRGARTPGGASTLEDGTPPEAVATAASQEGIAALGVNCGRDVGIAETADILRRYRSATNLPLFARPNAGSPLSSKAGPYPLTPAQMAAGLLKLVQAGALMVGGCCGTTPAHIAELRLALARLDR